MNPSPVSESFGHLMILAVVFGCGYVTLLACFAKRKSTNVFLGLSTFDKFFLSFQWGAGITTGSLILIIALSPSVGLPHSIEEFIDIVNAKLLEILGFNCVAMSIHHWLLPRLVVDRIVRDQHAGMVAQKEAFEDSRARRRT